jgi:hypothetical protein
LDWDECSPLKKTRINAERVTGTLRSIWDLHNDIQQDLFFEVEYVGQNHRNSMSDRLIMDRLSLSEMNNPLAHTIESEAYPTGAELADDADPNPI